MDLKLLRRVGLEIKCVPAILDLVQRHPLHAVLSLDALRGAKREAAYAARQIVTARNRKPLTASLWVDHISAAPRGLLLEQALPLVVCAACWSSGPLGARETTAVGIGLRPSPQRGTETTTPPEWAASVDCALGRGPAPSRR
ncbi:MAG TPA: hypothetical protein VK439_12090 [Rubrivivax sp.]|nr:hypothetical protein [Rubrivivax sp.]